MNIKLSALATAMLAATAGLSAPAAHAITITRAFSGLWHDTARANRALGAEVVQTATGKTLFAYWMTVDAAGKPMWVVGKGPIVGNRAVLNATVGSAAVAASQSWGKITVSFGDCAHGTVQFAPNDARQARGQTTIARVDDASANGCTGGISDDRLASDNTRIVQFFANTGVVPAASGKARFEERSDRTDFKIEAEDLPIGTYSLRVDGAERATIDVATSAAGTEGEVEFRSPAEPGKILLDFDPRGRTVEIAQGDTVFLTMKLDTDSGSDDDAGGVPGGEIARYELNVEAAHDGPELKAELEERPNAAEFSVELEDFLPGTYTLRVAGADRGTIDVAAVEGGTEGEIEFRDPPEPDHLTLDFDPRGQSVEIVQDGAVVLSGTFPTQPTGGDDDGDGGNDDPPGDDDGDGNDDPPGDDNGGGGNDDPPGDDNGGGGNDDPPGDDNGGGGNDDPPGDDHGGHRGKGGDD